MQKQTPSDIRLHLGTHPERVDRSKENNFPFIFSFYLFQLFQKFILKDIALPT